MELQIDTTEHIHTHTCPTPKLLEEQEPSNYDIWGPSLLFIPDINCKPAPKFINWVNQA